VTIRSAFRALGWIVSEIVPGQAVRVALDRDYSRAVTRAAAAHDAVEGLNEFEAENDGLEAQYCNEQQPLRDGPGYFCTESPCHKGSHHHDGWCWTDSEPGLADDELIAVRGLIQERYHTDVPAAGDPPRSPQPAAGDTHPSTTIANTLNSLGACECGGGDLMDDQAWREHVSPLIAQRIERALSQKAFERQAVESGADMGASFAREFFPQHLKGK
jgi:hypothetical protein